MLATINNSIGLTVFLSRIHNSVVHSFNFKFVKPFSVGKDGLVLLTLMVGLIHRDKISKTAELFVFSKEIDRVV